MEYTISLAFVDFLPVVFTAAGMYFIVRMVSHINMTQGRVAAIGAVLIVSGGFLKAVWKLGMAVSGNDIRWMDEGLFVWMAPGYTLLVWSIWQAVRMMHGKKIFNAWLIPAILIAFTFAISFYFHTSSPDSPAWRRLLLSVVVLASIITSFLLIVFAFRQKLFLSGALFIINLITIIVLNGLARMPEQTIALQWTQESINSISWLCFVIATKDVFNYTRNHFGVQ